MQSPVFDSHMHSLHSPDAAGPVDALCRAALQKGLTGIAVTDHCDLGRQRPPDWQERLDGSLRDIQTAADAYRGKLEVRAGVELGQPLHEPELAREVLSRPLDVVLASVHNLRGIDDFFDLGRGAAKKRELLTRYFDELLTMAEQADFDVLTHLTYPYCYLGYDAGTPPIAEFEEALRAVFSALARRGKALEVNTSRILRPGASGLAMPEAWELSLYRECGGELVTLGSDAHRADWVASGLKEGTALLKRTGFSQQVFFRGRKPFFYPLG